MHCMFYTRDRNVCPNPFDLIYFWIENICSIETKNMVLQCFHGKWVWQAPDKAMPLFFHNYIAINKGFQTMFLLFMSNYISFVFIPLIVCELPWSKRWPAKSKQQPKHFGPECMYVLLLLKLCSMYNVCSTYCLFSKYFIFTGTGRSQDQ